MGQCFTKQESQSVLITKPKITQVLPNPPKKRLRRTRSKIILEIVNLTPKP